MSYMIELEGALLPVACAGPQCQRASYAVILRNMKLGSYRVGVMKWQVMRCWTDVDRCMYRYWCAMYIFCTYKVFYIKGSGKENRSDS